MIREQLPDALKSALKETDQRAVSTFRLIMAALKDRDIAPRSKGNADGIGDAEILQTLKTMGKQRRESITMYEKGGRLELAEQEAEEIKIIQRFLPEQLDAAATEAIVAEINLIKPHAILVGMGMPRPEAWVARCYARLQSGVVFTVGGAF